MPGQEETWRFEAESEWPPLRQEGAFSDVTKLAGATGGCASNQKVLDVIGSGTVTISLPVAKDGRWRVIPRVYRRKSAAEGTVEVWTASGAAPLATWSWTDDGDGCVELGAKEVALAAADGPVMKIATKGTVSVDKTTMVYLGAPVAPTSTASPAGPANPK
jgi:hypothetical protein